MSHQFTVKKILKDPMLVETLIVSLVLVVISGGLIWFCAWVWVMRHALMSHSAPQAGTLLVCGHRLQNHQPTPDYIARLQRAVELLTHAPELRLILLGGGAPSEAAAGRRWLLANTVIADSKIGLEEQSENSFENLRHARELCIESEPVYVLSSRYHLGRLRILARQLGLPVILLTAEPRLQINLANLWRTITEAGYVCWFVCGLLWAKLGRRQAMLHRLTH
ncbi:MAG: YdcF family protein [Gammaproteobacteria bacterium]|jgi:uncharacterized SAM-binding protein YcdF (DUF218 family)|nr:YdcF family protein [Gammaproteobacteria bacterium]